MARPQWLRLYLKCSSAVRACLKKGRRPVFVPKPVWLGATREHTRPGSVTEEQQRPTGLGAKTLRAAVLLSVGFVGSVLTARSGDARTSPPRPPPKSPAAGHLPFFRPAPRFLRQIDRKTPAGLDLHLVLDNYGTHNHAHVHQWLEKHPRFQLHFTPTSSSWPNLVERWFGEITRKRIRRGIFKSIPELIEAIQEFIRINNQNPKLFVWTKKVDQILEKVGHCKAVTETPH
jgi:transposase